MEMDKFYCEECGEEVDEDQDGLCDNCAFGEEEDDDMEDEE